MNALARSFSAPLPQYAPAPICKSAQIVTHRRFSLEAMRDEYRESCIAVIEAAFPSPSPNACAAAASKATGIPRDTFYRILRGETKVPDITAVMAAVMVSPRQVGSLRPFKLMMRISEAQR